MGGTEGDCFYRFGYLISAFPLCGGPLVCQSWFVITLDPIVSFYGLVFVSLFLAHLDFNI